MLAACTVLCGSAESHAPAIVFQVAALQRGSSHAHHDLMFQAALLQYALEVKTSVPSEVAMFVTGFNWYLNSISDIAV